MDAVDESEQSDRRDILSLLFELCTSTKYCVIKIFVASRPVKELEARRNKVHNIITLQDETKTDIRRFTLSYLYDLNLTEILSQAMEYIVENAQGVFLWVKLVKDVLLTCVEEGYSEGKIFEFLKHLPTELEDFYRLMFEKMDQSKENLLHTIKIFQFVLFARRPLSVDELLHSLGIPDNPNTEFILSDESFRKCIPFERRIISCGGNFLEIKPYYGDSTGSKLQT